MKKLLNEKIINLANSMPKPLYIVGGASRDFLIDKSLSKDIDLCSPLNLEVVIEIAKSQGLDIIATYSRTNTAVLFDGQRKYEFTCFRKDIYGEGGKHSPLYTEYTEDIKEDALRRDFKCNAVYYDIKNSQFCDVLGGIEDIKNRVLSTVKNPAEVFSHDGLRLMRLARFSGELGFKVDEKTLIGARENADKIKDISKERIFDELKKMLVADKRHSFSDKQGHYNCLKVLDEIGVLQIILPQLCLGKGLEQRKDFHNYDVFNHSLRCVLYAPERVRLVALFHDIGKPFCYLKDGNFYQHPKEGEMIAKKVLCDLKASKKEIDEVGFLTKHHMIDMDLNMSEKKVRRFILNNYRYIPMLFEIKQADFSACKDQAKLCPTVQKWKKILGQMKDEKIPFSQGELDITSKELMEIGYRGKQIGEIRKHLFSLVCVGEEKNSNARLKEIAKKNFDKNLKSNIW